jgi:hypothetical protein
VRSGRVLADVEKGLIVTGELLEYKL